MKIRRLLGVIFLVICAGLVAMPVLAGFAMAGVHVGFVMFFGLGGLILAIA